VSGRPAETETRRQLEICNACRLCEGLCAVFPALERRGVLEDGDVLQLASLCHDCRACLEVCPYAPPHPFGVNLPLALAARRDDTIASLGRTATPAPRRPPVGWALFGVVVAAAAVIVGVVVTGGTHRGVPAGSPYRTVTEAFLLIASGGAALVGLGGLALGGHRYWHAVGGATRDLVAPRALLGALADAATLRYLGGGKVGCASGGAVAGPRRILHQAVVVGFLGCLAATVAAAISGDVLDHPPPYGWGSVPVLAGISGGALLVAGTVGLRILDRRRDAAPGYPPMLLRDIRFLDALAAVAVTGIAELLLRRSAAGPPLLGIHLALVWAAFLLAARSKFAHAPYRLLALVRDRIERR
jgi:citrate/tricarballylate utilization protein